MKFTLYTADTTGNTKNCLYPHEMEVTDARELAMAVEADNVCGRFKNSYRSGDNFISCNSIMMDIDNDHSEDPGDWVTMEAFATMLPDVSMALVPSRNNMKEKNGKAARPKFHVMFPVTETEDSAFISRLKKAIHDRFPFFDGNALDAVRFAFGSSVRADDILWQDGWLTIDEAIDATPDNLEDDFPAQAMGTIPDGQRNTTLSRYAGRILKRYGESDRAIQLFTAKAETCETPLSDRELKAIWSSAVKFYRKKVSSSNGYVPPDAYGANKPGYLKPDDYSDIGEAKVLVREYKQDLAYTIGTGFLCYTGLYWNESKQQAIGLVEEFLDLQLEDSLIMCAESRQKCKDAGFEPEALGKKDMASLTDAELKLYDEYMEARKYYAFVMKRRDMKYVTSTLQAATPMIEISVDQLDADPFLLNTPAGTLVLRKGIDSLRPHDSMDYITKITKVSPSDEGQDLWEDQLDKTFLGKQDLIEYTQMIFGEDIFGRVENERLTIPFGSGRNGKSTVCNSIMDVLGSYAGTVSADVLTAGCKRNPKPEIAELKGKRLLIAGELEQNVRLSTSIIKQICSTDVIRGEKKYCQPMDFYPSHSICLFTNHLPKVSAMDDGIWRRLVVIPFNACFEGNADKKNYTQYLVENAGGYILQWLIEGAKKVYEADFHINNPADVQAAIDKYRSDSDWFTHFIEDCCEVGDTCEARSGDFYEAYRSYAARTGDYARSTTDFYNELESRGFSRHKKKDGFHIYGVRLIEDDELPFC